MALIKGVPRNLLSVLIVLVLFSPLFFLRIVIGSIDVTELMACAGALLIYLLIRNRISRAPLSSVLLLALFLSAAVFALALFISPKTEGADETAGGDAEETELLLGDNIPEGGQDSLTDTSRSEVQRSIDSLAVSGGEAIRNVGLFTGSGTVGRTLGAVGEVTSATAEILIRTVYAGSNVAMVDTTRYDGGGSERHTDPLRLLALILAAVGSITVLTCLRYLVLIERKKRTLLWFRILVVVLLLRVMYVSLGLERFLQQAVSDLGNAEVLLSLNPFYVLLLVFALWNGFRIKWIHYLNRWRKYLALAGSLAVLLISREVVLLYYDGGLTFLSGALGSLVGCIFTILLIFSGISTMSILFMLPSARLVDRKFDQLRILDGLGQSIFSTFDEDRIISSSTHLGRRLARGDDCWCVIMGDGGGKKALSKRLVTDDKWVFSSAWYEELIHQLERAGGTILLNRYPASSLAKLADVSSPCPGSLLASLMRVRKRSVGIICAATSRQFGFMSEIRSLFGTFARQTAAAVENARMMETELERERYSEELAIARSIQESLLPGDLPGIPGYAVDGLSIQSHQVGGDYYDVFPLPGGLYGIAIADVSGKGAAAALLMAALQSALHAVAPGMLRDAGGVVGQLNRLMIRRMPDDKFITFFYGVLEPSSGKLSYCCAGHDPPVLVRSSGLLERLDEGGLVLGIVEDWEYVTGTAAFGPNDRLILYTDGVTESMSEDEDIEFGFERLTTFSLKHSGEDPSTMIRNLVNTLDSFRNSAPASDDLTLLVLASLG